MTETEWLACADPEAMLEFLQGKASNRKMRLFACGCMRQVWHLLKRKPSRTAVEAAEQAADGFLTEGVLLKVRSAADQAAKALHKNNAHIEQVEAAWAVEGVCCDAGQAASSVSKKVAEMKAAPAARQKVKRLHCDLILCVIGTPFRPVPVDLRWLTSTVVALADGIYADRAFDRLPILADALQDAGCEDAELLAHCRGPGPHVRGCWAVDLVLGKG